MANANGTMTMVCPSTTVSEGLKLFETGSTKPNPNIPCGPMDFLRLELQNPILSLLVLAVASVFLTKVFALL
eukprot:7528837-Pyramimonas_sp.AAC.1